MNAPRRSVADHDAITDAAAQWCMRLHAEDCSASERAAFEQWLAADPLHALEYEAMLDIWQTADHLPRPETAQVLPLRAPVARRPRHWRAYGVAAAISLLALPLAAWTGWNQGWLPNAYERFESTNAISRVILDDGSHVELNLGTELVYSNYKHERRVTLKKGEAFFRVQHDSQHPFVVQAGDGRVKVTGTQFNVWKYDDRVQVTLVEGSVLVSSRNQDPDRGFRLEPGMQARYKGGDYEPQLSQTYANDTSLAWRGGKLILDNLSLGDALPLINRYLDKPLLLADRSTGAIRISGIYNTADIKRLVRTLPRVLPIYLTQDTQGNTLINPITPAPKG